MSDPIVCGTTIQLRVGFTDENGTSVDPDTVAGTIRLPDETEEDLAPTRLSLGVYSALFTPEQNGLHQYRFDAASGIITTAVEDSFIAQTQFPED